jgi:hypothetical protein
MTNQLFGIEDTTYCEDSLQHHQSDARCWRMKHTMALYGFLGRWRWSRYDCFATPDVNVLLSLLHHAFGLLRKTASVIGDGGMVRFASGLVGSRDVEDTVGINIEGDLDLENTTTGGRNSGKFEFAEQIIVLSASTFTFVDLNEDTHLVIGVH